jgi:parallel beta-helix repeat protein
VGAYYLDANTPVQGYRTARPIIDGEDRLPSGDYTPLVYVMANRVRVENLTVRNSEGRGISVIEANDAEIIGCVVSNTYDGGIVFMRSQGSRAENNLVTRSDIGHHEDGRTWNAAITMLTSPSTIVRNNTVSEVWGEGINANKGSHHSLIEGNYVYGVRAVGIYLDSSTDLTVRRNIIVGTVNNTYWRSGSSVGPGIALNNERYHYPEGGGSLSVDVQVKRAKIYGNLVAYTATGIALWGAMSRTAFEGTLIYNNTFVDNNVQVSMGSRPITGSKFINNVLLSLSGGTRDVEGTALNGMVARNNYFSQGDPGGDYVHAGNRFTGLRLAKMSGWRSVTSRDQISWRDFVVASSSPVIGAGDDEPRRTSDTANDYMLDYNRAEHGAPMDIGALTFATPVRRRPLPPNALTGT